MTLNENEQHEEVSKVNGTEWEGKRAGEKRGCENYEKRLWSFKRSCRQKFLIVFFRCLFYWQSYLDPVN